MLVCIVPTARKVLWTCAAVRWRRDDRRELGGLELDGLDGQWVLWITEMLILLFFPFRYNSRWVALSGLKGGRMLSFVAFITAEEDIGVLIVRDFLVQSTHTLEQEPSSSAQP